ncbi:unnamed protein product [Lepeophtheirus salmonis]|uniref:(salmon louse) hypothetical protein n=1 Tax=Lepeophtheirus salmonis TaxID=72036 RepID=A0A7R8CSH0_LEPSM|nr:unnamed protein product [Lepeophtheirus salmonis]CAF2916949.1 unnamed protein product [Lepeophtheirus salmonis]
MKQFILQFGMVFALVKCQLMKDKGVTSDYFMIRKKVLDLEFPDEPYNTILVEFYQIIFGIGSMLLRSTVVEDCVFGGTISYICLTPRALLTEEILKFTSTCQPHYSMVMKQYSVKVCSQYRIAKIHINKYENQDRANKVCKLIKGFITRPPLGSSKNLFWTSLLGLNNWYVTGNCRGEFKTESKTSLKLSKCDENKEFTCNDGDCISIGRICDNFQDCEDESDEKKYCSNIEMINYKKEFAPSQQDNYEKLPIQINFSLHSIRTIQELENIFTILFRVQLEWEDPRLNFMRLKSNKPSILTEKEKN